MSLWTILVRVDPPAEAGLRREQLLRCASTVEVCAGTASTLCSTSLAKPLMAALKTFSEPLRRPRDLAACKVEVDG
jgi:hypothetical protein